MAHKTEKVCSQCKLLKKLEMFPLRKEAKDGRRANCKECQKEYQRKYREENPEKRREYNRKYYEENREKCREWKRKYREENPEKVREYDRKYSRKYYEENPEKCREKERKSVEIIADGYIKGLLAQSVTAKELGIKGSEINQELVDFKRAQLTLKRQKKEL